MLVTVAKDPNDGKTISDWENFPLNTMNKILGIVCYTMFGLAYLPGPIAGLVQLVRNEASLPFPGWFAKWMMLRKAIGLVAMWIAAVHMIASCLVWVREYKYYPFFMHSKVGYDAEPNKKMTWKAEMSMIAACFGFCLYIIVSLTSIGSVAEAMTWREWRFVQSGIGHLALLLCTWHVFCLSWQWKTSLYAQDSFIQNGWPVNNDYHQLPPTYFSYPIPVLASVLHLLLMLPGIRQKLHQIRKGQ